MRQPTVLPAIILELLLLTAQVAGACTVSVTAIRRLLHILLAVALPTNVSGLLKRIRAGSGPAERYPPMIGRRSRRGPEILVERVSGLDALFGRGC